RHLRERFQGHRSLNEGDMIRIERVYEPPGRGDGVRVLVDRLWSRGLSEQKARIDEWQKDLAPTAALRKWFQHDPKKWNEFQRRYRNELKAKGKLEELQELARRAKRETITLLFGALDEEHNNAVALKDLLKELLR
ncbi:MAG: DUF488 domain-containing protein, partial [Candidatus Methylomirabilales bacterium]